MYIMYVWMDGWMNEWMDGWMDERMDGWMGGWEDGWMDAAILVKQEDFVQCFTLYGSVKDKVLNLHNLK